MTSLRVFGLLPFRGLHGGKSRLGRELCADDRDALAIGLLNRAIAAMLDAGIERVAVVTRDAELHDTHLDRRAEIILQHSTGLNRAIRQGQRWALANGAEGLLIVLPDLPLVTGDDIGALLAAAGHDGAVIAPDRHGAGTNALLLSPPDAVAPAFGTGSAGRHRRGLALADIPVTDVQRPGTQLDLDTPDDLHVLDDLGYDWHSYITGNGVAAEAARGTIS